LLLAASLLGGSAGWAQKLNPGEKRTLELSPGVVLVLITYKVTAVLDMGKIQDRKEHSYIEFGSGFIYRPDGYIVTNGHVVQHANQKDPQATESLQQLILNEVLKPDVIRWFKAFEQQLQRPLTEKEQQEILGRIRVTHTTPDLKVYLANRKGYSADIKAYSGPIGEGKDVAILKIDATNLPTVKLGNSDNIHIQEPIIVIGYPGVASPIDLNALSNESLFIPTVTNGHVSAVKSDYKGTPVIQSDAAITHGNSGGPAFNEAGEVIGIATFGSAKEVAGFNFFVPINTGWEFVRQAGTEPQSGLFNQLWAQALDLYDTGKCTTAKEKFTDVLRILPNEPDAQRLMAAASACESTPGNPFAKLMETNGPIVYGVGAVILLGLLFLVLRKKPAPAAAGAAYAGPGMIPGQQPMGAMPPPGMQQPGMPPPGMQAGMPPPGLPAAPGPERSYGSVQITSGSLTGRRFPITKQGLLIGRDAGKCQVVLNEDTVSKEHAWIVPLDTGVVVIDRGSANGTFVNSTESPRVSKVGLQNGDRVYIGKQGAAVLTYYTS
jgi:S1-C subfamily serine protease